MLEPFCSHEERDGFGEVLVVGADPRMGFALHNELSEKPKTPPATSSSPLALGAGEAASSNPAKSRLWAMGRENMQFWGRLVGLEAGALWVFWGELNDVPGEHRL